MPYLENLYNNNQSSGLTVLGVEVSGNRRKTEQLLKEQEISYPIVFGSKELAVDTFKLYRIPSTFLIDGDGIVRDFFISFKSDTPRLIEEAVGRMLRSKEGGIRIHRQE